MQVVKLNLARNCLKYLIRAYGINEIFVPFYTCNTVWNSVRQEGCKISFYHIDQNFMPIECFPQNAFILYTNYFGLCNENCNNLARIYPNLIIDNSQAFYSESIGLASFNSLRKFFDVTNGGFLYTNKILNEEFEQDFLVLPSAKFNQNYSQFLKNELILNQETTIKLMSNDVEKIIKKIDFNKEKERRINLFIQYENIFKKDNDIPITLKDGEVPYCYPFCTNKTFFNKILNENNIILLKLWKNYPKNFTECFLNNVAAMPLDDEVTANKIISLFS